MKTKTFAGKFLSRLDKIDRQQIEAYLLNLIQAKDFLELIFNRMLEGIIVTDLSHRILFMNKTACKPLGLKENPVLYAGKNLLDLVKSPRLRKRISDFNPSRGEIISEELSIQTPKKHIFRIRFLPVGEEKDITDSMVFLISDITEQKKAEQIRIQKQRIMALANLTAGVAHEIKNPLNSLQIHAQLLKKYLVQLEESDAKRTHPENHHRGLKSVDIILEEISRLSGIVNQFLTAVSPVRIELEPGNVNNVLKKVVEIIRPTLDEKGIELELKLEPAKTEIQLNEQRLSQAFLNIIKNAQEAMEETRDPKITIHSYLQDKKMVIDFIDNGCGIPEKNQDKLFEPYFTTKFNGSGLGLTAVYRIINEHQGSIQINSHENEGTRFSVTLPLSRWPVRLLTEGKKNETKNFNR